MKAADFFTLAKKYQAEMVDLKFVDMLGSWQHCSFPIETWDEGTFEEGLGFDGSSIRGWKGIHESDMMAVPDPDTSCLDPFFARPTVSIIANVVDPVTREDFSRDPRHVARKAEAHLRESGVADTCYVGPEPEFFIFDEVRYEQNQHKGYYEIDSVEGAWNTARIEEPNLGYKPSFKGGYFPVSPTDTYHDLRGEMVYEMRKIGIVVEAHHHEVATAGQSEIDMRYAPLVKMADQFMWYKYICKNVARRHGKTVTFMPKPVFEDNGSGMHTHISLWKGSTPLFAGDRYAGLSELGLHAAGGLLRHAAAILAFAAPTTNSYCRLVPGFEAPVNLALSARNRSAAIRIPMYRRIPRRSGWSSVAPIRVATATWRGPRWSWRCSMASDTGSIQGIRWIATSTRCRRRSWRARTRRRGRSTRRCGRWRKTTISSRKAASSPTIWSAHGSTTSATTRSIRCACARTRTSSLCITTIEPCATQVAARSKGRSRNEEGSPS